MKATTYDWNAVWDVKTQRFEQGWTVEFAIPFKSLRYDSNPVQVWGVQPSSHHSLEERVDLRHAFAGITPNRPRSSMSHWAPHWLASKRRRAANLEVKPYAISGIRTDLNATPRSITERCRSDVGLDAKYGLSKSLTLDLTYNTDFAQVEDDTQQVNLTRFNQFFPERRDFFLEGQGLFTFGPVNAGGAGQ